MAHIGNGFTSCGVADVVNHCRQVVSDHLIHGESPELVLVDVHRRVIGRVDVAPIVGQPHIVATGGEHKGQRITDFAVIRLLVDAVPVENSRRVDQPKSGRTLKAMKEKNGLESGPVGWRQIGVE